MALKISKIDEIEILDLSDDKFKFLYIVYENSETNIFARVNTEEVQTLLSLPQSRILSLGEFLDKNELIKFDNWYEGIRITHKGIIKVEADLLGNIEVPEYVRKGEIKKIEEIIRQRFHLLQSLYKEAEEDTFKLVSHVELAQKAGVEHNKVISQILP